MGVEAAGQAPCRPSSFRGSGPAAVGGGEVPEAHEGAQGQGDVLSRVSALAEAGG